MEPTIELYNECQILREIVERTKLGVNQAVVGQVVRGVNHHSNLSQGVENSGFDSLVLARVEVVDDPAEEVEERGSDGGVRLHRVVHHQNGGLDVHDVVLVGVEEQPVVEQSELGVARRNLSWREKREIEKTTFSIFLTRRSLKVSNDRKIYRLAIKAKTRKQTRPDWCKS